MDRGTHRAVTGPTSALSLRGIVKSFGPTRALDGTMLDVRPGTLHALLGENGAGKTTLMRLAFGMLAPDAGTISVDGTVRRWRSSADAIAAGLGMVHQHFLLVPAMTVAENVALGDRGFFSGFNPRQAAERVRRIGEATGLMLDPAARVATLPVGAQQRLEIVKALARNARLLILDEPTAVLAPGEARELQHWLRGFVARGGTVVLITHKVREALAIADDVTVLRRGRTVLAAACGTVSEDEVVTALLGEREQGPDETHTPAASPSAPSTPDIVLRLEHVSVIDAQGTTRLHDTSMNLHGGEIIGVAGIEGAGQAELLRVLAGRLIPDTGQVTAPSRIGFVPEDRLRDAVIPSMTLTENLALKDAGSRHGLIPWHTDRTRAEAVIRTHDVRTSGASAMAGELSGGNQQKFVLGRELEGLPPVLIAENPTRGLDIRAAAAVRRRLREARDAGIAIVVYSSDLEELLAIADRMLVCFAGHVTAVARQADVVARALVGLT